MSPRRDHHGFRGPFNGEWPSRETALAIVEALKTADGWDDVGRMAGMVDHSRAQKTAHDCYMIYGYPELEPVALARWTAGAFDRRYPKSPAATHTGPKESRGRVAGTKHPAQAIESPTPSYGLTRR